MSMTLEQTIAKREGNWVTGLLNSQAFWVLVAIIVAAVFLSFATQAFATPQNLYNVTHYKRFDRGGHFAALEEPDLFVADVREFFRTVR